jgi:hypothetical protein
MLTNVANEKGKRKRTKMEVTRQSASVNSRRGDYADSHMIGEKTLKRIGWTIGLMLLAFLVGFVASWLASEGYEVERAAHLREGRVSTIRHSLAAAALHTDGGRFEEARKHASDFFHALRTEIDKRDGAFAVQDDAEIREMLSQRDEVITMLARDEQATADILATWYFQLESGESKGR